MPLSEIKEAAKRMVPALKSDVFYSVPFGPLGRIQIVLPELPDGDYFETEFEEVLEFVERIMARRKEWRKRKVAEAIEMIAPALSSKGGAGDAE